MKNGELLQKACQSYNMFITCDQDLVHQRNLEKNEIGVLVLKGKSNRKKDLEPLLPLLIELLKTADTSTYEEIG